MGKVIYDKEGNPINYTKSNYNPQTQQNETIPPVSNIGGINESTVIVDSPIDASPYRTVTDYKPIYLSPEDYDEDYDAFAPLGSWDEMNKNRIQAQSGWAQSGRAVVGGLLKGLGTALKDIGYMTDWRSSAKLFNLMDMEEEGWLNETLNSAGDWIHESVDEYAPIYEDTSSASVKDQFLKWGTLSGILDSAVGFAIPGGFASKTGTLIAKGVSSAGKIAKWTGRLKNLTKLEKVGVRLARADVAFMDIQKRMPKTANILNVAAPALFQGIGEGMWEAKDAYTEHLESLSDLVLNGDINLLDANNQANDIAQDVLRLNMAKTFLNYHAFSSMATKFGKGLVKKPTIGGKLKGMLKAAPLEGIEEGAQDIFKKEAEYRALKAYEDANGENSVIKELRNQGKYKKDLSSDFYTRMTQLASTNDVILASIIGAVSGPIQQVMTRGFNARKRFKQDNETYIKQQKIIKNTDKLFESKKEFKKFLEEVKNENIPNKSEKAKKDLDNTVNKTVLTEKLSDIANEMDSPIAKKLVEKQAFATLIQESLAAGTYEHLKSQAQKFSNTDHHMASLLGVMKTLEPLINKSNRYANTAVVFNKAMSIEMTKDLRDMYIEMQQEVTEGRLKSGAESLEEHDNLISLNNTIKKIDKSLIEMQEDLDFATSFKVQNSLFKQERYEDEMVEVYKNIASTSSLSELNQIARIYPELVNTKEFVAASKKLGIVPKKVKKVKSTPKTNKEIQDDKDNSIPSNKKGLTNFDLKRGRTINESSEKLTKYSIPILSSENIDSRVKDIVQSITEKVSDKSIENISKSVYKKYNKIVDRATSQEEHENYIATIISKEVSKYIQNNRPDVKAEREPTDKEIKRLNRKRQIEVLPEESIEELIAFKNKTRETKAKVDEINAKSVRTAEEGQLIQQAEKELSQVDEKVRNSIKKIKGEIKNDITINPNGKNVEEILPNFEAFLTYMSDILGDDYVSDNFIEMQYIYRAVTGDLTSLPMSYIDAMRDVLEFGLPTDMPTIDKINKILKNKKAVKNTTTDKVLEEHIENQKSKRMTNNLDAAKSIAHLSKSYHIEYDENGKPFIVEGNDLDLAVFLNPLKYNSNEKITFKVSLKEGVDKIFDAIRHLVVDDNGNILPESKEFNEFIRAYNLPHDSIPEDFIPISIIGPDGKSDFKYVHLPMWANKLHKDSIEFQRVSIREMRLEILNQIKSSKNNEAKGNLLGKVMYWDSKQGKYKGFVMNDAGVSISTAEAIKEDVEIGSLGIGENMINKKIAPKNILNFEAVKSYPVGMSFIFVPINKVGKDIIYHAEPIFNNKLSAELSDTAMALIEAYLKKDANSDIVKTFKIRFNGLDVLTPKGLEEALNNFMYVFKPKNETDFEIKFNRNKDSGQHALLSINKKTGEISFGLGSGQSLSPSKMGEENLTDISNAMKKLKSLFNDGKFLFNVNQKKSGSKKFPIITIKDEKVSVKVIPYNTFVKQNTTTTLVGSQLEDGSYTYTLQNIMTFDVNKGKKKKVSKKSLDKAKLAESIEEIPVELPKKKLTILTEKGNKVKAPKRIAQFISIINKNLSDNTNTILGKLKLAKFGIGDSKDLSIYIEAARKDKIDLNEYLEKEIPTIKSSKVEPDLNLDSSLVFLGLNEVTKDSTEKEIADIVGNQPESELLFKFISNNDVNGLLLNVPYMKFYKEQNLIENDLRYKELSEEDQEFAEDLYKLNNYNKDKIFNIAKRGQLENVINHIDSRLFNRVQELVKECK